MVRVGAKKGIRNCQILQANPAIGRSLRRRTGNLLVAAICRTCARCFSSKKTSSTSAGMSPKNAFVNGLNPVYLQKNAMFDMMRNWIWKYFQMNPSVNRQTSFRYPYLGINAMEFIDRLPATTGDGDLKINCVTYRRNLTEDQTIWRLRNTLPSGELTFCYGKSPFFMGKSTINGKIHYFYGHFQLLCGCSPEGRVTELGLALVTAILLLYIVSER